MLTLAWVMMLLMMMLLVMITTALCPPLLLLRLVCEICPMTSMHHWSVALIHSFPCAQLLLKAALCVWKLSLATGLLTKLLSSASRMYWAPLGAATLAHMMLLLLGHELLLLGLEPEPERELELELLLAAVTLLICPWRTQPHPQRHSHSQRKRKRLQIVKACSASCSCQRPRHEPQAR